MLSRYGDPGALTVLVQMVDEHDLEGMESEVAEIQRLTDTPFCLLAVKVQQWNRDLSPWKAPAVFGTEAFGGEAGKTLAEVLQYCKEPGKTYIIGGYSLAGLFALWAAYQTDVFAAVAAASPSVWFPGFIDYMKQHPSKAGRELDLGAGKAVEATDGLGAGLGARPAYGPAVNAVYLSQGDKEEKTRNPVMATVGSCIKEAYEWLKESGMDTILEWNQGNHFKDADLRTAKAFAWAMKHYERRQK